MPPVSFYIDGDFYLMVLFCNNSKRLSRKPIRSQCTLSLPSEKGVEKETNRMKWFKKLILYLAGQSEQVDSEANIYQVLYFH